MVVKPLLTLLGTPDTDAVLDKPLHHKGRFICDTANAVKHEHQKNIKLSLAGVFLDDLELVTVLSPDLVAGYAVLLLLMDDTPAFFLRKAVTGFPLHGNVGLTFIIVAKIEKGDVNPSFEVLSTLVKTLCVSFDAIFDPASEQVEAELQEIAGLYRTCPEQGRHWVLATMRTMVNELLNNRTDLP